MQKISILIVEDFQLVREVWSMLFGKDPRFQVLAICESAEEGFQKTRELNPDVVITDINLKGMDGFELTKAITEVMPHIKVLAVSMHVQVCYVQKIIRLGAAGYVTKNSPIEEMFAAVVSIYNNQRFICEEIRQLLAAQVTGDDTQVAKLLSLREMEVIDHLKQGHSSTEIGKILNLSKKTVEVHRYNIMKKLNVKNTAALINHMNTNWQGPAVRTGS
jgi:two-component system invasion response regulator UvrY